MVCCMLSMNNNIEVSEQFRNAYEAMERGSKHVFVTGKAGTGKSTLLRYFRERTRRATAVVAPTGVAAVNIDGQTIHSFFKLRPGVTVEEARHDGRAARKDQLFQKIETIVIDEFSNRVIENGIVKKDLSQDEMMTRYNSDKFSPVDGKLIKLCDKLAAFIEASLSLKHGIRSAHLEDGKKVCYEEYRNATYGALDFGELLEYYN